MNRRKFLRLTGAALSVPMIGLPVSPCDIPILHAHGKGAPVLGFIVFGDEPTRPSLKDSDTIPFIPCTICFSSKTCYYPEIVQYLGCVDREAGTMLVKGDIKKENGLWFHDLHFSHLPDHPEYYEEADFNAIVKDMVLNET